MTLGGVAIVRRMPGAPTPRVSGKSVPIPTAASGKGKGSSITDKRTSSIEMIHPVG